MNEPARELAAEHARLKIEIDEGKQELQAEARELMRPLRSLERSGEQLTHFLKQYSLLLLPVVVLAALHPRATVRLSARVAALWLAWHEHPGPEEARLASVVMRGVRGKL